MKFILSFWLALLLSSSASGSGSNILKPQRIADGVYVFVGIPEDVAANNSGNVINSGFIVGDDGVIVIDPGVNYRHGRKLRAAISAVTKRPVTLVIDTHPHPENVLGNSAFSEVGARVVATPATVQAMKQRCEVCLQHVTSRLGKAAMAGTEIVIPEPLAADVIEVAARELRLLHYGWGHTEGDLAVLDVKTGVLFAGGLVSLDRIPVMLQARVKSWIAALERLREVPAKILVPGNGPVSKPRRIDDTLVYLRQLLNTVQKQYAAGDSVFDALRETELPAFRNWALYAETNPLNVQHVYSELERAEFQGSLR